MDDRFFDNPILNSPYECPGRHWELDATGQPTLQIVERRRQAEFITPIPQPRRYKGKQQAFVFDEGEGLSTQEQQYEYVTAQVNGIRSQVDTWRKLPNPNDWGVTPETARLLAHWRSPRFDGMRPFFCQIEAVETLIWLTEVAPKRSQAGRQSLRYLETVSQEANSELRRLALKMATGTGKTMVMAMIIAWQTVNAARHPNSRRFTRGFLVVTPGITIKDRLRVLQPNDPDSYYANRQLIPTDMLGDLQRARIVITNYHAFQLRERLNLSAGGRRLLQGRSAALNTLETEGQMMQRVMPGLMGMKNILVLNDEGHHCYRRKASDGEETRGRGEDRKEADRNNQAARVWISGLEIVRRKVGIAQVIDLSATPFFLQGSGYAEGTLFPWTVTDFSLMDAIECGIVKLPRVPVADNLPSDDMPKFRDLWIHIRPDMPKKTASADLAPLRIPVLLQTALQSLYGHYAKTFALWQQEGLAVPPCFIVVCNNTATSKLVYDYVSGFERERADGSTWHSGARLPLFSNFDDQGKRLPLPRTLLIDSRQLESGEILDKRFRTMAAAEIDQFRRERIERTGDRHSADNIADEELLREALNTVGKEGRLGAAIHCVVSVSMLTEGWDANTVTHVLGVRAFGTQLLCEQVIGRALRRQSYELNEAGLFNVEYADVFGVPFDFAAKPVVVKPTPPRPTVQVRAIPERERLEIRFPRVQGYRVELPQDGLTAQFTADSILELTPELVGPTITQNRGIIGQGIDLNLVHTGAIREATLLMHLTRHLLESKYCDRNQEPEWHLFGKLKPLVGQWLQECLRCKGDTFPAQLMYLAFADMACERIAAAITRRHIGERPVKAMLDSFHPAGSTADVSFTTSRSERWKTDARKCHVNWAILDSSWETEFCRVVESHPCVKAYARNYGMGFEVPYRYRAERRTYIPDFIVQVNDGAETLTNVVVEIKGLRDEAAKAKKETMETYWVPGVNGLGAFGRWAFAEFTDIDQIENEFNAVVSDILKLKPDAAFRDANASAAQ